MKLFDLHADIGYDVIMKKRKGIKDIVSSVHAAKFKAGEIAYVGMASCFEGNEDWQDMQEMVSSLREQVEACPDIDLVLSKKDFDESSRCKAFLTIEGMCGIKENPIEKIHWLYDQGVRIASLCWNDENALATGVRGNPDRGLSAMGKALVQEMIALHMVIDVSHANEKTFWDIMNEHPTYVMATHSNVRERCDHPRNLNNEQLQALQAHGGLVGIVSAPMFVSKYVEDQDLTHLVQHVKALKDKIGIQYIAVGFDFMDFYENYDYHLNQLSNCTLAQNFIKELKAQAFSDEEIKDIAYRNALAFMREVY